MSGTFHIIHFHVQSTRRRVPIPVYERRSSQPKTREEERIKVACGKIIVIGEEQYCNISIATPEWDKDWCHDCVKAFPWTEDARKMWLGRGIETLDSSSWNDWLNTPEGKYANPGASI